MSYNPVTLDSGVLPGGASWTASGISPACGFTLTSTWQDLQSTAFSVHPLQLLSDARRHQLAAETLLQRVAKSFTGESYDNPEAAALAIGNLKPDGVDTAIDAAHKLVAGWRDARATYREEQDQKLASRA